MGAIVRWIRARSTGEILAVLSPQDWDVYAEDDPERPKTWDGVQLSESDIDEKDQWLPGQIYIQQRKSEGKRGFAFRGTRGDVTEYRTIWARDVSEITARYPGLESLVGVTISWEDQQSTGYSDIDEPDEFLAKYGNDA
jgi:hypothetical protein